MYRKITMDSYCSLRRSYFYFILSLYRIQEKLRYSYSYPVSEKKGRLPAAPSCCLALIQKILQLLAPACMHLPVSGMAAFIFHRIFCADPVRSRGFHRIKV